MIVFSLGVIVGIILSFLAVFCALFFKDKAIETTKNMVRKDQKMEIVSPRDILGEIVPDNYEYHTDRKQDLL